MAGGRRESNACRLDPSVPGCPGAMTTKRETDVGSSNGVMEEEEKRSSHGGGRGELSTARLVVAVAVAVAGIRCGVEDARPSQESWCLFLYHQHQRSNSQIIGRLVPDMPSKACCVRNACVGCTTWVMTLATGSAGFLVLYQMQLEQVIGQR